MLTLPSWVLIQASRAFRDLGTLSMFDLFGAIGCLADP